MTSEAGQSTQDGMNLNYLQKNSDLLSLAQDYLLPTSFSRCYFPSSSTAAVVSGSAVFSINSNLKPFALSSQSRTRRGF